MNEVGFCPVVGGVLSSGVLSCGVLSVWGFVLWGFVRTPQFTCTFNVFSLNSDKSCTCMVVSANFC